MMRLPRSIDDLRGLRAARWIRESTAGQFDRYGPDSQRHEQDRFIERFGLLDTGLVFTVAQSGRTVWRSPAMAEMLAAAGRDFDVILMGYFDRWQRNTRRTIEIVEDRLHPAGAAWVMCDRRLLSSDPRDWREMRKLASEAEEYSEKLGERIADGYAAKFRTLADQAGTAPLGFRRQAEPPHALEVDPATVGRARNIFELYATGSVSERDVASQLGYGVELVAKALRSPLYNGWVRRHRGPDEERRPAAWRADPPVSDELWNRVADLRARRHRGGGPSTRGDRDLLRGLLFCAGCGRRLRADGMSGTPPTRRVTHREPCADWGLQASRRARTWEWPIEAQWAAISLDARALTRVRRVIEAPTVRPIDTTRARIERQMRELAADHVAQRIDDAVYLSRLAVLRTEATAAVELQRSRVDADEAIGQLTAMARAWRRMTEVERAKLAHAVYARIEVVGGSSDARVVLTPAAYEIGLDQALPEFVRAKERPRLGLENHVRTAHLEIAGKRERGRAAKSA